jgi:hypothetical protein
MEDTEGFIVITMTHNETKFLRWTSPTPRANGRLWTGDLDIDDYTQNLSTSYVISESTLATGLTKNGIIQVSPSGIYLGDRVWRRAGPEERIVQAAIVGSEIVVVVYDESGQWNLVSLQIIQSGSEITLVETPSVALPREPTTLKLFINHDAPKYTNLIRRGFEPQEMVCSKYCFVAFRFPRKINIYGLIDKIEPFVAYELELDQEHLMEPDDPQTSEIHSMELLVEGGTHSYLLVGLRNGLMMNFRVEFWEQWNFFDTEITKLGSSPVEFISGTHTRKEENRVFAMCEYLWEICLKNRELGIEEVLFDDFRVVMSWR